MVAALALAVDRGCYVEMEGGAGSNRRFGDCRFVRRELAPPFYRGGAEG